MYISMDSCAVRGKDSNVIYLLVKNQQQTRHSSCRVNKSNSNRSWHSSRRDCCKVHHHGASGVLLGCQKVVWASLAQG